MPDLAWFALRVKPRAERVVADVLDGKGYEYFLPMHRERRRWSDRVKTVDTPLFAGYLFCRFDVQFRLPILTSPGVLHVVSIGKVPEPIPDEEIESLQVLTRSGLTLEPWPFLQIGEQVRIVAGPLAGAAGVVQSVKDRDRLVVSVTLLQRSVAVVVPESCLWPASA
ncbi:MAG: UpxY family transcription antiterminator [Acidobacteria bacterium]|nr:UpxY family transcription antiterminator [Acidobacteriota bacterium]